MGGGEVVPVAGVGPDPLEGEVGEVVDRAVGVALGDVIGEVVVDRFAVGDAVGADHPCVADVDHAGVGDVEADAEAHQEQGGDHQPHRRPDRPQALSPPPQPDPETAAQQVEEDRVDERDRDADLGTVEEVVGDAEAEQDEQVEVGDTPEPPPVDQAEEEDRAERQEDVGRVEPVAKGAGVSARHLPGHLIAGPRLEHLAAVGVDQNQRQLVAAFEVGDLPMPFLHRRTRPEVRMVALLLDDLRIPVGNLNRFRRTDLPCISRSGARSHQHRQHHEEEQQPAPPAGGAVGGTISW